MSPARKADRDLDSLIDEITVDCNDEYEQLTGFEVAFDEDANFPCSGTVVGEEVEVLSAAIKDNRRELITTCKRGGRRYDIRAARRRPSRRCSHVTASRCVPSLARVLEHPCTATTR